MTSVQYPRTIPTPPKDLAAANDALAVRWAGPFGYAVLETLRRTDGYGEADFWDFAQRAPLDLVPTGRLQVVDDVVVDPRSISIVSPGEPDTPGALEPPPAPEPSPVSDPSPPPDYYRRVTTAGRPGQYPAPAGTRDQSGRFVRPVR